MTVHENLPLGRTRPAHGAREAGLADVFAPSPVLEEQHAQHSGSLSGGEQQMCALGSGARTSACEFAPASLP